MFSNCPNLKIEAVSPTQMPPETMLEIRRLCDEAYGEDLAHLFAVYTADWHILAHLNDLLVGHAMIVTRWLQAGDGPMMRTAYVEMVATAPAYQRQGVGTAVMQKVAAVAAQQRYDLAALCPADTELYGHLGWEYWQGRLFVRPPGSCGEEPPAPIPTPEEQVMVLRLPATPELALGQPLSAEWREGGELW